MSKVQIENLDIELELRRLMLGGNIPAAKTRSLICPDCPFKTSFCEWRMSLVENNDDTRMSCKGTRAWITQRN